MGKKSFQELRNYFNDVDPVGIFFKDNVDEYDSEIGDLLNSNIDLTNETLVSNELRKIFSKWFEGIKIREDLIVELARKISNNN